VFYHPPRALGILVGSVLTAWALGVALLLVNEASDAGVHAAAFVAYAAAIVAAFMASLFAYWTFALATLSYALDRNGLVITWGTTRQIIPLQSIERLVPAEAVGIPRVQGVSWWGHHVGNATIERIGRVLFYSAHQSPDQVLYVMTTEANYAISVEDPAAFAKEVQIRQDLGPITDVTHHVQRAGMAAQPFWSDPQAQAIAAGAIAAAVLVWVYVAVRYDGLPATLTLRLPPTDDVIAVTSRESIFNLPRAATALLGVNLVIGAVLHAWDRVAGYLVLGAAAAVQAMVLLALVIALT